MDAAPARYTRKCALVDGCERERDEQSSPRGPSAGRKSLPSCLCATRRRPRSAPRPPPISRFVLGYFALQRAQHGQRCALDGKTFVDLPGRSFASRVGASLLEAVGLPNLVCATLSDYEATARRLAANPDELQLIKTALEANRLKSRLFDSDQLCRDIEEAYLTMSEIYQRGETPCAFAVGEGGTRRSSWHPTKSWPEQLCKPATRRRDGRHSANQLAMCNSIGADWHQCASRCQAQVIPSLARIFQVTVAASLTSSRVVTAAA